MWKRVLFDFVRQEFSGPGSIRVLIVYCLFMGPMIVLGGSLVAMKLIDSTHVVAVVLGKDPLFTWLLVLPMVFWMLYFALRFVTYLRSHKNTEPEA